MVVTCEVNAKLFSSYNFRGTFSMADFPSRTILQQEKQCNLAKGLQGWNWQHGGDMAELSHGATFTPGIGFEAASKGGTNVGIFVPYYANRFSYGFAMQGKQHEWMATGPFSGCKICIFSKVGKGVGMGHISVQSGSKQSSEPAWDNFKQKGVSVHYEQKIPLPIPDENSASYVFLDLRNINSLKLMQIDLRTTGMDGYTGKVFRFKHINEFSKIL